jgi:hypothetical protein
LHQPGLYAKYAHSSLCTTKEEQIADMVYASHTRRRVLQICDQELIEIFKREEKDTRKGDDEMMQKQRLCNNEQKFWVYANKAEAHYALGEFDDYKKAIESAKLIDHKPWMIESFEEQRAKLRVLLERNGHLLNPAWKEK